MKTALVTGANRGIGLEIARQLAEHGFHVFLGSRDSAVGEAALSKIEGAGGKVTLVEIDVAAEESIARAVQAVAAATDSLDVLVNNAGVILDWNGSFDTLTVETLQKTLETNTYGPLRVAKAFHSLLAKSSAPRVINISSGGGQLSDGLSAWAPAYCISKTALNAVTCQMAAAWPKLAVNSVCPGWVRTDMGGKDAPRSVEEGADTPVWLATEAPQSLTGQFVKDREAIPW